MVPRQAGSAVGQAPVAAKQTPHADTHTHTPKAWPLFSPSSPPSSTTGGRFVVTDSGGFSPWTPWLFPCQVVWLGGTLPLPAPGNSTFPLRLLNALFVVVTRQAARMCTFPYGGHPVGGHPGSLGPAWSAHLCVPGTAAGAPVLGCRWGERGGAGPKRDQPGDFLQPQSAEHGSRIRPQTSPRRAPCSQCTPCPR